MTAPVLVEVTRGPEVESRHRGQIAVVDSQGNLRQALGDPEVKVCMRSLAKPFQVLPLLATGAAQDLGLGPEELALCSGSLSGQDFQVELIQKVLARLGLSPEVLACGVHPPLHRPSAQALVQAGAKPTALHHTCAGKHTAMLALCVHQGWPVADYLNPEHPVQKLILGTVARLVGLPPDQIPVALDGCRAPVFSCAPQEHRPGFRPPGRGPEGESCRRPHGRLPGPPRHIAGDGRLETGHHGSPARQGLRQDRGGRSFALAIKDGGLGVALKIEDGASRPLGPCHRANPGSAGPLRRPGPPSPGRPPARDHPQPPPAAGWPNDAGSFLVTGPGRGRRLRYRIITRSMKKVNLRGGPGDLEVQWHRRLACVSLPSSSPPNPYCSSLVRVSGRIIFN